MAPGATHQIVFTVTPAQPGEIENRAEVQGAEPAPTPTNNTATATTTVQASELFLSLDADAATLLANGVDTVLLTITAWDPLFSVAGQVVTLTWDLGFYPSPVTVTLNSQGVATYTAGTVTGTDTISATMYRSGGCIVCSCPSSRGTAAAGRRQALAGH